MFKREILQWFNRQKTIQWGIGILKNLRANKRNFRRILTGGIIFIIMLIPYPYESGGSFKFLPVQVNEVHTQVSGEIKKVLLKKVTW